MAGNGTDGLNKVFLILICGDRDWKGAGRYHTLRTFLIRFIDKRGPVKIISGGARGADYMARAFTDEFSFPFEEFNADWETYGKAAGPIRNSQMLAQNPNAVVAFHDNLDKSRGTVDTMRKALKKGIPVYWVNSTGEYVEYTLNNRQFWPPALSGYVRLDKMKG